MKTLYCFGIIPLRRVNERLETLLILHRAGEYWGFPKGKKEEGEDPITTAKRELFEETGLNVSQLFQESFQESYSFYRHEELVEKIAVYFIAFVEGSLALQAHEVLDARWVSLEEAPSLLTFPSLRNICQKAVALVS